MNELIKPNDWKRFAIPAILSAILFIILEIIPVIIQMNNHEYGGKVIDKAVAEQRALTFAQQHTGMKVSSAHVVHQSDKLLTGYLDKEKLTSRYEQSYDSQFPADTFQVNIKLGENNSNGFVYIHMYNERVTGWNLQLDGKLLSKDEQTKEIGRFLFGQQLSNVKLDNPSINSSGEWIAYPNGYEIGQSKLQLVAQAQSIDGRTIITKYKPAFVTPEDYKSYVKKQDSLAGWLTGLGYALMSFILGVLAIIYAIVYRKYTSFKYGIILTVVFLITYIIMNLGVTDGIIASQGESAVEPYMLLFTQILTIILAVVMAVSIYFSIVAGDGLWKQQGKQLWPRLKDSGYGDYVWRSMGLSYLFAIIMLGLQPIIFQILSLLIGTWGASDVTMSPYNMSILWLMPVLAWAAAISEEAVFRFFGIGLFRKWFRHTFAATLLPTLFWALGHVMYPFYPATTRLFELMIIGLLFSFIFVKYGFITAMFTHAIFNSVAVGSSLFIVGGADNIVSAIFFILLPVLIAYILRAWSDRKRTNPPTMSTIHPVERQ